MKLEDQKNFDILLKQYLKTAIFYTTYKIFDDSDDDINYQFDKKINQYMEKVCLSFFHVAKKELEKSKIRTNRDCKYSLAGKDLWLTHKSTASCPNGFADGKWGLSDVKLTRMATNIPVNHLTVNNNIISGSNPSLIRRKKIKNKQ